MSRTAKRPAEQNWRINNSKINIASVALICCGATCILIRLKNFLEKQNTALASGGEDKILAQHEKGNSPRENESIYF